MNLNFHSAPGSSRFERWYLGAAWTVIVLKCLFVWWVIPHFHVPVHPMWIIGPTLFGATFVTVLRVTHHE